MKRWIIPNEEVIPADLRSLGMDDVVNRALLLRGIYDAETARGFLDPSLYTPTPASDFPGLGKAIDRIRIAIRDQETICVWGDFDVDGLTSTAVLTTTLTDLGARVIYHIPNRDRDSHGVKMGALKEILDGGVGLVLTCDTGSSEVDSIAYAQNRHVDVIVTDHHELPEALPPAYAMISPRFLPADHPFTSLPGVGVAVKLAEELYKTLGRADEISSLYDLAALGIVADVAALRGDTRYLLQLGIEALRKTKRAALQAMYGAIKLSQDQINEEHIGFLLAPRLNAVGRLADSGGMVEFMTTKDVTKARITALQLEALNARRKHLCDQVFKAARSMIDANPEILREPLIFLDHPSWPTGIIGIAAGQLAGLYNRPAILVSSPPGGLAKGSARSVAWINITEEIRKHKEFLANFGGHPAAAGFSLPTGSLPEFRRHLMSELSRIAPEERQAPATIIDGFKSLAELDLQLAEKINLLAPFGNGNPPVVLACRDLKVVRTHYIGKNQEHMQILVEDAAGETRKILWWQAEENQLPQGNIDLAFTVRTSTFRGENKLQLEWIDARPSETQPLDLSAPATPTIEWIDCRYEPYPEKRLTELQAHEDTVTWREGRDITSIPGCTRYELTPAANLILWTPPPSHYDFVHALVQVNPAKVYIFTSLTGMYLKKELIETAAGLVKYALNHHAGVIRIHDLAARLAIQEIIAHKIIEWMDSMGYIEINNIIKGEMVVQQGRGEIDPAIAARLKTEFERLHSEMQAYRDYLHTAPLAEYGRIIGTVK